jgi:hypothetical protein
LSTSFRLSSGSGRWTLRGAFQAVDANSHQFSYDVFPTVPFATNNFGMDVGAQVPVVTMPASTQAALQDPSQYTYEATMDHLQHNVAKLRAENLDFDLKLSDSGFFRSLQAGARYADHSEADQTSGYNWQALGVGWNGSPPVTFAQGNPGDYSATVFDNFFQGKTALPGNVLLPSVAMASRADLLGDRSPTVSSISPGTEPTSSTRTRLSTPWFALPTIRASWVSRTAGTSEHVWCARNTSPRVSICRTPRVVPLRTRPREMYTPWQVLRILFQFRYPAAAPTPRCCPR